MAAISFLLIQALLVGVSVLLLRPGTDVLAERVLGGEVRTQDLRLVGAIVVTAAVLVLLGALVLDGPVAAVLVLGVSVLAGVGAEVLVRRLHRPEVQTDLMRRLERGLERGGDAARSGRDRADRVARQVTSRARRAGEERAARRR